MDGVILDVDRSEMRNTQGWCADGFPELPQFFDTLLRRIAGDQCSVHGTDRNAGNPIRMEVSFGESLIDAGLIGAERPAALQQQNGLFKPATFDPRLFWFFRQRCIHDREVLGGCRFALTSRSVPGCFRVLQAYAWRRARLHAPRSACRGATFRQTVTIRGAAHATAGAASAFRCSKMTCFLAL